MVGGPGLGRARAEGAPTLQQAPGPLSAHRRRKATLPEEASCRIVPGSCTCRSTAEGAGKADSPRLLGAAHVCKRRVRVDPVPFGAPTGKGNSLSSVRSVLQLGREILETKNGTQQYKRCRS